MFETARIAEQKIKDAIEEGKFDNLPGKGKPLNLEEDSLTPPHLRMANRILKNAGVLPDWMQIDLDIDRQREECARHFIRLAAEYPRRRTKADAVAPAEERERARRRFAEWHARERRDYARALRQVNGDIVKLTLLAPSVPRVHVPFRIAEETERFDTAFPALPDVQADAPDDLARKSDLRDASAVLYQAGGRDRR